jgi:chromosome segregation ATPase
VNDKEEELQKLQVESQQLKEKEEKMRGFLTKARASLAERNKQVEERDARIVTLTDDLNKSQVANEEMRVRNAALQSQYEARTARSEKELNELRPLAEAYQAQQTELVKQPEEPAAVTQPDSQQVRFCLDWLTFWN